MTNNKARDNQKIDFMINQFLQELFMVLSNSLFHTKVRNYLKYLQL